MKPWWREIRPIPLVLIAAGCLLALKAIGLVFDGGYTLAQRLARGETMVVSTVPLTAPTQIRTEANPLDVAAARPRSWMQEMFNYPDVTGSVNAPRPPSREVTGAIATRPAEPAKGEQPAIAKPDSKPAAAAPPAEALQSMSSAERALLERLQARRQEIEARARELELRETLVKAAEKKLEQRLAELKAQEARLGSAQEKKEEADRARFKSLVTMYETMKPKDAAKIFDRLDMKVLVEVSSQINPRRMSEIMSVMNPEAAEKLTVELTSRARPEKGAGADLPKIEGRPTGG